MKKILFQGDSITDAGRLREDETNMGMGYPVLVKGTLGLEHPGEYTFINKGISGDRIVDLYARIKADIINLKPDIISILIGVNDVWHEMRFENGVNADKYFKIYCMLIDEIKEALPNTKIMILEPFLLKADRTEESWDEFRHQVELRAKMAKLVAEEKELFFVPLQKKLDQAAEYYGADYWLFDGVHPSTMGHELIKREWIQAFYQL